MGYFIGVIARNVKISLVALLLCSCCGWGADTLVPTPFCFSFRAVFVRYSGNFSAST